MGDTEQRMRERASSLRIPTRPFSQPLQKYGERIFLYLIAEQSHGWELRPFFSFPRNHTNRGPKRSRMRMNIKIVGLAFLVGGAVVAGCAQLKLMSNDPHVRVAAVSELRPNELEQVLYTPTYSEDVIEAAAKRVYESNQEQALSYYEECEYKNPTAAAKLANCFNNPKGWEHLFEMYSYQNNVAGRILYSFVNSKTGTFVSGKLGANYAKTGSEVGGGELLAWAVKNMDKRGVSRFFGNEDKIIEKMSDVNHLMSVAEDAAIGVNVRQMAACKLLKDNAIKSDVALKTVNLFKEKDEKVFSVVAAEGLVAARRIGDENLINEIKEKTKPCVDETLARSKGMSAKLVSIDGYFIGMERWRAALLEQYNDNKGVVWDSELGNITRINFGREYVRAVKGIAEADSEKWARQFLRNVGITKDECVSKDGSGKIVATDKDSHITISIKNGVVDCIVLESALGRKTEAFMAKVEGDIRFYFGDYQSLGGKPKEDGIYELSGANERLPLPIVKQVIKGGIVVGAKSPLENGGAFKNQIFIKTSESYANGDSLLQVSMLGFSTEVKYYKSLPSHKGMIACRNS